MMRRVHKSRAGMTLLELMVSTVLTIVIFNITAGMFVMAGRISAMSNIALDRLDGVAEAQSVFMESVRDAREIVPAAAGFETSDDRIVLRTDAGITVFGRLGDAPQLGVTRLELQDGEWTSDYLRPLRQRFGTIVFEVEDRRLATLDLEILRDPEERPGNPTRYRAVAGCRGIAGETQP